MAKDIKDLLAKKLAENNQRHATAQQAQETDTERQHLNIPLTSISTNPYQPRTVFDEHEISLLAASIAEIGLLQPISVRQVDNQYQLIAGERRLRATQLLGHDRIDAIVVNADDADMAILGLAENLQRQDLSDYEIGKALRQIGNIFPSKTKLAEALGLNREDMYRYYAFEALPENILKRLDNNPVLLSRSAAADIKRILQNHTNEKTLQLLDSAWDLLEQGRLLQGKVADYIIKHLTTTLTVKPDVSKLMRGKKAIGTVERNNKGIIIKFKTDTMTAVQEAKLKSFLEDMVAE
jgi:ParB family chromosome partitioning protein